MPAPQPNPASEDLSGAANDAKPDERTPPGSDELRSLLSRVTPFGDLPDAVIGALAEISTLKSYDSAETLYALGQYDGGELLVVSQGSLKATIADGESGAMMIDTVNEGEIFGLSSAVAGDQGVDPEKITLAVEASATIIAIEAEAFRVVVAQRPSLTRNLMHYFAKVLAGARYELAVADESSPERRIYAALMDYIERDAVSGAWRIDKMPKHRELAEKADTEEPKVASAVAQLIQDGIAKRDYPGLIITDMNGLSRLSA